MSELLKIGGYIPPSPQKYDVSFSDFNGAEEDLENGSQYIEQVVTQKPSISVSWKNVAESDAVAILASVKPALVSVEYFFGEVRSCTASSKNPKISLAFSKESERYYDIDLTLEG